MLFVLPLRNLPLTFVPSPPPPPPPPPRAGGEGAGARADLGPELGLDHQLVHRLRPADDDPVLLAAAARCPQDFLHRARIDVLAAHDEHVVHAPVDSPRQPRVGAPALAGLARPGRGAPPPPRAFGARGGGARYRRCPARGACRTGPRTRRWSSRASFRPWSRCPRRPHRTPPRCGASWPGSRPRPRPRRRGSGDRTPWDRFPPAAPFPRRRGRRTASRRRPTGASP